MDGGVGFPSAAADQRIVMAEGYLMCLSRDKGKAFEVTVPNEAEFGVDIKGIVVLFGEGSKAINKIGVVQLLLKESFPGVRKVHVVNYSKYSRLELCSLLRFSSSANCELFALFALKIVKD